MTQKSAPDNEHVAELHQAIEELQQERDQLSARINQQEQVCYNQRSILESINMELRGEIRARTSLENALAHTRANWQRLCDMAEDSIFLKDSKRRIIFRNRAMREFFGVEDDKALGMVAEDCFPPGKGARIRGQEERVLAGETITSEDTIHGVHKTIIARTIKAPIRNENGTVVGICCIARDITAHKSLEEELRKTNERLQGILDHSTSLIYIKNLDGCFELVNNSLVKITGTTKERLLGRPASTTLPPEEARIVAEEDRLIIATGKGRTRERHLTERTGPRVYITSKFPLFDAKGKVTGICVIDTDITETKRLQAEAARAAQLAAIGELAAGVAHEINNPINGVINYAQILLDELGPNDPKAEMAQRILRESWRVAELVKNLLSFARNTKRSMEMVSFPDVLTDALNLVGGNLRSEQIDLSTEYPKGLPPIWGNFSCLQQVLVNLLVNAGHAIRGNPPDAPRTIRITAQTVDRAPQIQIQVQDTGIGMDKDTLANIFNPFFTTKPRGEGTGLGLYICYQLMREHDGSINAESTPGQGTTFTLLLPAAHE